jgi:hypothetical protein
VGSTAATPRTRSRAGPQSGGDLAALGEQLRCRHLHGAVYDTARLIPGQNLGDPFLGGQPLTAWTGGQVAVRDGDHLIARVAVERELREQSLTQAAFSGLSPGTGVVRHQHAHRRGGVLAVTQIPSAIQRVEPRHGQRGRVPDVMQPRGGLDQVCVPAQHRPECPGLCDDTLRVHPPIRQRLGQHPPSDLPSPDR